MTVTMKGEVVKREKLFKVLDADGSAFYDDYDTWRLPQNGQPGDWMPSINGKLIPYANGYHLYRMNDLIQWLGPAIYAAEYRGEWMDDYDQVVVREARLLNRYDNWNDRTARLFACDCAEHVLGIYEKQHPDDNRVRQCIEVARQFAKGEATREDLSAARDAVRVVAVEPVTDAVRSSAMPTSWDAAYDAAEDAVRASAWNASKVVAGAAGWNATGAIAWNAARDAEYEWQTARLMQYLETGR